jgi:ABC-type multidrug transport system, ATPase and permease components
MPKAAKLPFPQLVREFWKPYLRLTVYLKPYKKRLVLGLFFGVLAGLVNGLFAWVVKTVGDKVLPGGPGIGGFGAVGNQTASVPTDAVPASFESVVWISLLIPAAMILRGVFTYLNSYCLSWVSLRVLRDIRSQLFQHIMNQSMAFFSTAKSGKLISRVINDTRMAQNALTSIAGDLVKAPIAVISGAVVIVWIDWKFSLTSLVLFPLCMVPVAVFGRKIRQAGRAEENEAGQMAVILQETFAGVRIIKSFAREDYQAEQFAKSSDQQCRNSLRVRKSMEMVGPIIESVSAFGVVLALAYVYFFNVSIGQLAGLLAGIFMLYNPVKSLSRIPMQMQKCMASATNIFNLLEKTPAVQDAPNAAVLTHCAGRITFDRVSFSYGKDKNAVHDINLDFEAGKKYALVGSSGAGKSTLLSLIQRFYDPQVGTILLDGRDIRTLTQRSLREHIGVVTQDTFLFHDTIYENIRYGRLDATPAEVEAAAKQAYAHDFIIAQPEGYQTVVGDKGCMLSGGQQQRLAIARALLKNAPILLLDEATSALDSEAEKIIQAALERLSRGRTVIAIAHRLSTILKSDQIVVMDHGRIVDVAPHAVLLERSPLYRKLYEMQFHHEDLQVQPAA